MSSEDAKRILGHIKKAQTIPRSKKEIIATFLSAGIIDKNGKLKDPYKDIYIPVRK